MICKVRSDCQFCDLWLVGFWYDGWVLGGVAVGFVGCKWVWPWVGLRWCGYGFRGLQMGVAVGFKWVSGAFGIGYKGFTVVKVLWVFLPPVVVAGYG